MAGCEAVWLKSGTVGIAANAPLSLLPTGILASAVRFLARFVLAFWGELILPANLKIQLTTTVNCWIH